QRRRHIERFVVIIRAFDVNITGREVSPDTFEKIREARPPKAANHIPAFNANVTRVLPEFRKGLNLVELVIPRLLDGTCYGKAPAIKVNSGVINVVIVDWKLLNWRELRIREGGRKMTGAKEHL